MIRCLLELYFDDQYLADHCAKGRLPFGSSNPADSRPAIDSVVLGAIKGIYKLLATLSFIINSSEVKNTKGTFKLVF